MTNQHLQHENFHISLISNIIFEPYFAPAVQEKFSNADIAVNLIPYGESLTLTYEKYLAESDMNIICLNYEALFPDMFINIFSGKISEEEALAEIVLLCENLLNNIEKHTLGKIIWFLFEDYYLNIAKITGNIITGNSLIDKINIKLHEMFHERATFIDLKRLIAEVGICHSYDTKNKYRWNAPYSKLLMQNIVQEIYKQYLIDNGITKKCLILDCDDVLWSGILAEDGIENIKLDSNGFGRSHQDFQRFVLTLYYHGIILAVCSKNDMSDVMNIFCNHSSMLLRKEYISCFQVNWGNKPDNIKKIARILNIGLSSIVFVDDSAHEIEAVKSIIPEVTAIIYERDTVYEKLSCFNLTNNFNATDIKKRSETYFTNQLREDMKYQYADYNEFIKALEIKLEIHEATSMEFCRISELTQRTNKCTNGKRYTVSEIKKRFTHSKLYSVYASDRFSDLGLVGAFEIENDVLTLFALSCRALGRNIEAKIFEFIKHSYTIHVFEFYKSGKNCSMTDRIKNVFCPVEIRILN